MALLQRNTHGSTYETTRPMLGVIALASFLALSACATRNPPPPPPPDGGPIAPISNNDRMQGAASEAARQPLRDVGILKKKIPYALSRIADPYATPSGAGCDWIKYELNALNEALGPEVAVMPGVDKSTAAEKRSRMAMDAASDFIRSSSAGLLPGRSLIRRISGAEKADMMYKAATERGMVRRGYLKGLAQAQKCS